MGQEILYCHQCGKRLVSDDFTRGRAHTLESRSYCSACVRKPMSAPPPRARAVAAGPVPPSASPKALVFALAGLAVAGIVALAIVLGSGKPEPLPSPPVVDETAKRRRIDADLKALEARVEQPVKLEQFSAAIGILREARKSEADAAWTGVIDQRIRAIEDLASERYPKLREQAIQARARGAVAEVAELTRRVAQWGMPSYAAALEKDLAAVKIAPPIPAAGLRFIPPSPDERRVAKRLGTPDGAAVEALPYGPIRVVGVEGELFQVPAEGEVQVTFRTDVAQPIQLRMRITGENGQSVAYDWMLKDAPPGRDVQIRAPFLEFKENGVKPLPAGSVIKTLFVTGHNPKVAFRVSDLVVVKRRD